MDGSARRSQVACALGVRLELLGSLRSKHTWRGANHRHAFWELLWYGVGSGEIRCAGRRFAVRDGGCFLVPPGVHHQLLVDGELEHLYVGFTWDGRTPSAQRLAQLPELPAAMATSLNRRFADLWRRCSGEAERIEGGVELLPALLDLTRWLQEGAEAGAVDAHQAVIQQAQAYLAANLDRTVTVREVAASCYLSPGHLGELFARLTGTTIKACHAELRLRRAAELLRQSDAGIHDIARLLGFAEHAYFSRVFKARFGVPPGRYRAQR